MIDYSLLVSNLHVGFVDLIIAGVGLAMSGAGLFGSRKESQKQRRIAGQVNAVENRIADVQQQAADVQFAASEKISGITQQQEELRRRMVLSESSRQARQIARETQIARANSVAAAENSGAMNSTGFLGAQASIQQQGAEQGTRLFENTTLAMSNFDLNRAIFDTQTATNRQLSGFNRQIAQQQTQLRTLGVQSSNSQARQGVNNTLFNTGMQIMGSSGQTADVFSSLFTGKRTG